MNPRENWWSHIVGASPTLTYWGSRLDPGSTPGDWVQVLAAAALGDVDGGPVPWVLPICSSKSPLFPASWCFPASRGELKFVLYIASTDNLCWWEPLAVKLDDAFVILATNTISGGTGCASFWVLWGVLGITSAEEVVLGPANGNTSFWIIAKKSTLAAEVSALLSSSVMVWRVGGGSWEVFAAQTVLDF